MARRKEVWLTWTGHTDERQRCAACGQKGAELVWHDDGGVFVWAMWLHRDCAEVYYRLMGVTVHGKGKTGAKH